ncbi:MAG: hypothetical protein V8T86_03345 [Victivallis sp.]
MDSYILDCCYARELDFEEFLARALGREKLKFVDEGQQAVFYNYVEERFEELTETYNRVDDKPKAPLEFDDPRTRGRPPRLLRLPQFDRQIRLGAVAGRPEGTRGALDAAR